MVTARRLYLYGVLGVALIPLLVGLVDLVRLPLRAALGALSGARLAGDGHAGLEDLSLALAMVAVAGPVWLIHWWLLRRTVGEDDGSAAEERASPVRATYFMLVLVASLAVTAVACREALGMGLHELLDLASTWDRATPAGAVANALAISVVAGIAWLGHLLWRQADHRRATVRLAGDWLTRLYLYGALVASMLALVVASAEVLRIVVEQAAGRGYAYEGVDGWLVALSDTAAALAIAGLVWAVHWSLGRWLMATPDPMGSLHRVSRARAAGFLAIVLVMTSAFLVLASTSLGHAIAALLDAWRPEAGSTLLEDVGGPLIMAAPVAAAWWWHARRAVDEAGACGGPDRRWSVSRIELLLVSLVGLLGLAVGAAGCLEALWMLAAGGDGSGLAGTRALRGDLAQAAAMALVGLALWLPAWIALSRARSREPVTEASSTSRRTHLLLVSAASVIVAMGALAWIVYQLMREITGVGPAEGVERATSVLLVVGAGLAFHLLVLRADAELVAAMAPPEAAEAVAATDRSIEAVEISGPPGADFESLNRELRGHLPAGYDLRVVRPGHP